MYRGSRKHVLDWTAQTHFIPELLEILRPDVEAKVTADSRWMPRGHREPDEARLEDFGPAWAPSEQHRLLWEHLEGWWLMHPKGASTPHWDLALGCEIEGKRGLVLVEAKAHHDELKEDGKIPKPTDSANSRENHARIAAAIAEACDALRPLAPGTNVSVDSCYQFSNRIAFAWKLATMGIPVALVYLGFIGDTGMDGYFTDASQWGRSLTAHVLRIFETPLDRRFDVGPAPFWVLMRARQVLEMSPSPMALWSGDAARTLRS